MRGLRWPEAARIRTLAWPYALVLPAVGVTILSTYAPIVGNLGISLTAYNLRLPSSANDFVGLRNYQELLGASRTWMIVAQTLLYAIGTTTISAVVAVAAALLIRRPRRRRAIPLRSLIFALVLLPWVMPPVVAAFIWKYLYAQFGPINGALVSSGAITEPIRFLTDIDMKVGPFALPMWSVIQVGIWASFPFLFVFANAAMSSIPDHLYEAAELEGATGLRAVRWITLPLIAPVLEAAIFLVIVIRFGAADLPLLLTGGGPLDSSSILGVFLYNTAFGQLKLGMASAIGMLLLIAAMPFAYLYVRRSQGQLRDR